MLQIIQEETNNFTDRINKNTIINILKDFGYEFPLDNIKGVVEESLGLLKTPFDYQDERTKEIQYLLRRSFANSGPYNWTTFFKLLNNYGYCIISLHRDISTERKPTFKIILNILTNGPLGDELDFLKEKITIATNNIEQWEQSQFINNKYAELSEDYTLPNFVEDDFNIAKIFKDKNINQIIQTIKSSGGMLRRDANSKLNKYGCTDELLEQLSELNLIHSEYVILCKKSSEQINRVPSKDSIVVLEQHGIRCRCGKLVSDELIEEILTSTEKSNTMIDGSHWMTVNLVEALLNIGLPRENILVNINDGPEEIDAIVTYKGKILLFELKDSQFSMGHAYAFQSRVGLYQPTKGVIWAVGGVAPEVKEYFKRANPDADLHYIENVEDIEEGIKDIIDDINWKIADNVLAPLFAEGFIALNLPKSILYELKERVPPKDDKLEVAASVEQ
ncbi:hypothetical protein [Fictibacillus arsenicus]|uniref:Uncharacterized protein n=1 Tax=Fictibacillus arsenicus TaxID=255247 RepID=A0A1V3G7X3_9BACL|nr:hypothetical protein [Fictibacillus arsenicus]OOE12501.1 hypothetical protein UN64_10470 [Fictibacillus arsenicus]